MAQQGAQWLQGLKETALSMAQREKKDEDEGYSRYRGRQKSAVLQECRCFNDRELNARRCITILTKILWLLSQGDKLTRLETTEVFFGVTKLLQAKDQQLRRLIYLILKELKPSPEEVIIVVATLTKDMNSKTDLYRANAIRVLGAIIAATDPTLLSQIERHLKQVRGRLRPLSRRPGRWSVAPWPRRPQPPLPLVASRPTPPSPPACSAAANAPLPHPRRRWSIGTASSLRRRSSRASI